MRVDALAELYRPFVPAVGIPHLGALSQFASVLGPKPGVFITYLPIKCRWSH